MPNFTRGAIALEGNLPFGADFYYGIKKTLITSLSDFTLIFLYIARNHLTRIASCRAIKEDYDEAMHKNSCRS